MIMMVLTTAALASGAPPTAPLQRPTPTEPGGIVSGRVMAKDKAPLANGIIYLFDAAQGPPPSMVKYWRVPDLIEGMDQDGSFTIPVPAGTYYLVATARSAENAMGPPKDGDLFYYNADPGGEPQPLSVASGGTTDMGVIAGRYTFFQNLTKHDDGITGVEGVIVDSEGNPVDGAMVFAFQPSTRTGRPLFVSETTGQNGRYLLRVHDGGTYYLKVRSVFGGGPPASGENLTSTEETRPVKVTLKKNEKLHGIRLMVVKFPKRGPESPIR